MWLQPWPQLARQLGRRPDLARAYVYRGLLAALAIWERAPRLRLRLRRGGRVAPRVEPLERHEGATRMLRG